MAELVWNNKHRHAVQCCTSSQQHVQTVEYYPSTATLPAPHWYNCLIQGDNQHALPLLLQHYASAIDLIYIDPPFMTGRTFGSGTLVAYSDTWRNDLDAYLQWLYEHLSLVYALLAPDGSLYVHLDWRTIHYTRILLDELFGMNAHTNGSGFKNEIIWHYQSGGGHTQKYYARKHDTLLLYTKSAQYSFHPERVGQRRGTQKRNHMRKEVGADGRLSWTIRSGGRTYSYHEDTLITPSDVWSDINHLHQKDPQRTGYATQKPEALLERVILASSEEQDLVLDCFCGSGVTPTVAGRLGRRWIACDKSELAIVTTKERLLAQEAIQPFKVQRITS